MLYYATDERTGRYTYYRSLAADDRFLITGNLINPPPVPTRRGQEGLYKENRK